MHLEVVHIEDVFPDKNNPRKKFEGIDELAESFDLNSERPGEPFTPPILVQDGGIYRIVDGERRFRALKKRGAKSFTANVCTDMNEANTVMAMLATDDKQPLDESEKARGVQTMLLLGVDPVDVEKASKIKGAAKVKGALEVVQDAAEDMSLERLIAIHDFKDDEEALEALTNCSEKDWRAIYSNLVKAKEWEEAHSQIEDIIDENHIPIVEKEELGNYRYESWFSKPEGLQEYIDAFDDISKVVVQDLSDKPWRVDFSFYYLKEDGENSEQAAVSAEIEQMKKELEMSEERRMKFFAEKLEKLSEERVEIVASLDTADIVAKHIEQTTFYERITEFDEKYGTDFESEPLQAAFYVMFAERAMLVGDLRFRCDNILKGVAKEYTRHAFENYIAVIDAFIADGYEPEDWEAELFEKIRAVEVSDD